MAKRNIYVELDFNLQSFLNAKFYPLSTANRTALSLVSGDKGIGVFDTDLNKLMMWNGSTWVDASPTSTGGMVFRGGITAAAAAPSAPANGDMYVFTTAGTTPASWTPQETVQVGDQVIWDNANSLWRYIQGNVVTASTAVAGIVALATQGEADTGTDTQKAITPSTLAGYAPDSALTRRMTRRLATNITSLAANTATTITHNLALANQNDLQVQCWQGNNRIELAVVSTGVNAITVESNVALSNVRVVCEG